MQKIIVYLLACIFVNGCGIGQVMNADTAPLYIPGAPALSNVGVIEADPVGSRDWRMFGGTRDSAYMGATFVLLASMSVDGKGIGTAAFIPASYYFLIQTPISFGIDLVTFPGALGVNAYNAMKK